MVSSGISTNQVFHSRENGAFDIQMRRHLTGFVYNGMIHGSLVGLHILLVDKIIIENVYGNLSSSLPRNDSCFRKLFQLSLVY